jgi:hypothetical protein
MAFGDWELFRMMIISLREIETSSFAYEEGPRSVRFTVESEQVLRKGISNIYIMFYIIVLYFYIIHLIK